MRKSILLGLVIVAFVMIYIFQAQNVPTNGTDERAKRLEALAQHNGMNPEWLACKTVDDCSLFTTICGLKMASNRVYVSEARAVYCKKHNNCVDPPWCRPIEQTNTLEFPLECAVGYCITHPTVSGKPLLLPN
jgi:hypothetical protein